MTTMTNQFNNVLAGAPVCALQAQMLCLDPFAGQRRHEYGAGAHSAGNPGMGNGIAARVSTQQNIPPSPR